MALNPSVIYDNSDVVWYSTQTYPGLMQAYQSLLGKDYAQTEYMLNATYGASDWYTALKGLEDAGYELAKNSSGNYCLVHRTKASEIFNTPSSTINSNATSTAMVKSAPVYTTKIDDVVTSPSYGKVLVEKAGSVLTPEHGFYGWGFFAGECLQAVQAASVGIWLGKTIDSTLYNLNPDFWDSHGMAMLNPETWGALTNGDDSFGAKLFNTIFGIDPETGDAQMFIDERAAAYLAQYMASMGVFSTGGKRVISIPSGFPSLQRYSIPILVSSSNYTIPGASDANFKYEHIINASLNTEGCLAINQNSLTPSGGVSSNNRIRILFASTEQGQHFTIRETKIRRSTGIVESDETLTFELTSTYTYNDKTVYFNHKEYNGYVYPTNAYKNELPYPSFTNLEVPSGSQNYGPIAWLLVYGEIDPGGIAGITDQPNAVLPNTSGWDDVPSTLQSLKNQYPDTFANTVPVSMVQPDGSTITTNYIPIPMSVANGQYDTQPTTGTQTQSDVSVQPTAENANLLKTIVEMLTQLQPNPETQTQTQTQTDVDDTTNPPTTGTGTSPVPIMPVGNSGKLWSVYHPTQAQLDSFGAWLWSTNFVDQLVKLFQNPIEGVISLHKIFATPVDSGTANIVVGTLDSGVSSSTVSQQYVEIDCGYVDCHEDFGTVFDYPPYTQVSLYLPFIGIVPLDTNDVMRSTLHVKYGVDVFTGACLAMVEVIRDANTVNLYQYAGMCAVTYPLTSVQNAQLLSGIITVAGGLVAENPLTVFAGFVNASKAYVGKSGGFSGNAGAMGIKKPYLIIQRPQTKVADLFPVIEGYPTNISGKLSDFSGQVNVRHCHVENIPATDEELKMIESLLKGGVLV